MWGTETPLAAVRRGQARRAAASGPTGAGWREARPTTRVGTGCLSEEAEREGCLYAFTSTLPSFALLFQPLLERVAEGVDRRAAQRTPVPKLKEIQPHQAAFRRTHEGLRPLHFLGQQDLAEAGSHADVPQNFGQQVVFATMDGLGHG